MCLTDLATFEIAALNEIYQQKGAAAFDDAARCSLFAIISLIKVVRGASYLSLLIETVKESQRQSLVHSPCTSGPVFRTSFCSTREET